MSDDPDRDAILRRRNRLIGIALSGIAAGTTLGGCEPCLSLARDTGVEDAGLDAGPQACLSPPPPDAGPPMDAAAGDAGLDAGEPMPCLSPLPPDAGEEP